MRTRRDFLTPALVIFGVVIVIMALWIVIADGQTHTMPGSNVVPSGASLTIQSGGSIIASPGSTVTGFGGGGGGSGTVTDFSAGDLSPLFTTSEATTTTTPALTFSLSTAAANTVFGNATNSSAVPTFSSSPRFTAIGNLTSNGFVKTSGSTGTLSIDTATYQPSDADLDTWATLTPSANFQTMVPHTFAQMKTDLGLVIGTNVQAWDTDLDVWATKTPYAGTVVVTTGKTFTDTNNLTLSGTDGSTLNIGGGGTLGTAAYTASTAYQAADTDLTTWAGVTPTSGIQTWLATPSSANLRGALTDENGTGAALFSGATTPDFTTGFTIGAAAASGKILVGNGTNFVPSTPTYPNAASPTARKFIVSDGTNWVASTETQAVPGTSGNLLTSDGTNWTSAAPVVTASNTLTFTNKRVNPRVTSTGSATTWAPSADTDDVYEITGQTAPVTTISNPAGTPVDGQSLIIRFKDNGTARALSWTGSQWEAGPGMILPASTIVGNHDYAGFKWNSTTSKWTMVACTQLTGTTDDTAFASSWDTVTALSPSKNAVYDELHKIDSADDGTIVNAGTGFRIAAAAGSGKLLQGNGTNFVASTATWPTTNTAGYTVRADGTNYAVYPQDMLNSSVSSQSPSTSDVYVAGSNVVVAAGDFKVKGQYRCIFDVTKSAGTGTIVISVRTGTAGTTSDTANLTFTFPAGTSVADVGTFEVFVNWRTIGSGTSAVVEGVCRAQKNLVTAAGLWGDTSAAKTIVATVSSGFASNTFTNMGVSFNGGTAFAGTITTVQSSLLQ